MKILLRMKLTATERENWFVNSSNRVPLVPGYSHRPAGWATGYMYIVHSCSWPLIILFTLQTDSREISVWGKNRMEFKVIHMKWAETSSFGSVDYQLT